jgi:hypothetical protein
MTAAPAQEYADPANLRGCRIQVIVHRDKRDGRRKAEIAEPNGPMELMQALFFLLLLMMAGALLWPAGAILLSRKTSRAGRAAWIGLWLLVQAASWAVGHFHYQYLLESGHPRKLLSRDAIDGVVLGMVLGWVLYLLFRYRRGDFPAATAALQRAGRRLKGIFRSGNGIAR